MPPILVPEPVAMGTLGTPSVSVPSASAIEPPANMVNAAASAHVVRIRPSRVLDPIMNFS